MPVCIDAQRHIEDFLQFLQKTGNFWAATAQKWRLLPFFSIITVIAAIFFSQHLIFLLKSLLELTD